MSDKYIRTLRRMARDRVLTPRTAEKLIHLAAGDWEESKHPRKKDGKFAPKGGGESGGGKGEKGTVISGPTGRMRELPGGPPDYADMQRNPPFEYSKVFKSQTGKELSSQGYNGTEETAKRNKPVTVFEKASKAKRDNVQKEYLNECASDRAETLNELRRMNMGTMVRLNSRGYETLEKNEDGSFTYRTPDGKKETLDQHQAADKIRDRMNEKGGPVKAVSIAKAGEEGRSQYWDSIRACADLKPNVGDLYTGKRVGLSDAVKNGEARAAGKMPFPKAEGGAVHEQTTGNGIAFGNLTKGSGVTKISRKDIMKQNPDDRVYNTLQEHCVEMPDGTLTLTPEREKLHRDIMQETFSGAIKPKPGEPKVFTMMGGGSAAGKGTIQQFGVADIPDKLHSPVIDADEMKKRIPEYVDTAFSDDHESAASMAHEESSALAKRAMQTAFANGYNCTLDGTGDGSLDGMKSKIDAARKAGYQVNGVYVTCPTEMAVERNAKRSQSDEYLRMVPSSEVRKIHSKVSHIFESVAPLMDHCALYDTNQGDGNPPKLICEWRNGQEIFRDKKLYAEFLAKDKEPKES